jgi:hypothetical protein
MLSKQNAVFAAVTVIGALFFLEVFASWALMLRMRLRKTEIFTKSELTYFSLFNIPYKVGVKLGLFDQLSRSGVGVEYRITEEPKPQVKPDPRAGVEYRITEEPKPQVKPDPELGYKPLPGKYQFIFSRKARDRSEWEHLSTNVTVRDDGTRWTGECEPSSSTAVYIFGDGHVNGFGVNDEQTFAFLFQQARKDMCVKLFAVGGYGMTQSYVQFHRLLDQIKPNDIVILGYSDSFDVRNVVAPSRLRAQRDWLKARGLAVDSLMLPKAALDHRGTINISYVQQRDENDGYYDQSDPPKEEMSRVTAALINGIAESSRAPVYLLHFRGSKKNPVFGLLSGSVRRISALNEDSGYFVRDDIAGFEHHPGPYWHYAISRKLIETFARPIHL